jgi:enoyl-CoA hydratase
MREFERLRIVQQGHVVEIRLTRPDIMNRFDAVLHREFLEALREVRSAENMRVILLTAEGRFFSAGGDFAYMLEQNADTTARTRGIDEGRLMVAELIDLPVPVVCALSGSTYGLGATIALLTDIVVSAPGIKIGDPHVSIGLVAGDGGCLAWPCAVGLLRAKRYLLTGEPVPAELGYQWGLISELTDTPEEVEPKAREIAAKIAALPPVAVQGTKRTLNAIARARAAEVVDIGFSQEWISVGTSDIIEAIDAFKEKRAPVYTGR